MTSQEETVDMDALKAEAKELKIPAYGVIKDPAKLQAKIDEAKGGTVVKRKKAPKMTATIGGMGSRNEMLKKLQEKDPDCQYITQSSKLTSAEAAAKGMEIVKKDNGDILYCGSDIVCRTDKESYDEWQNMRNEQALNAMKSIDKDLSTEGGGRKIQSLTEKPKSGVDPS